MSRPPDSRRRGPERRKWARQRGLMVALARQGRTVEEIARIFGTTRQVVSYNLKRAGYVVRCPACGEILRPPLVRSARAWQP